MKKIIFAAPILTALFILAGCGKPEAPVTGTTTEKAAPNGMAANSASAHEAANKSTKEYLDANPPSKPRPASKSHF